MANKQCFMPFFYDWVKPLSLLDKEECAELVLAMVKYHQNGGKIPEFTGMAELAANFIFPQLMRAKEEYEHQIERARLGGIAKQKQFVLKQECNLPTNTNTTTNTSTNTSTNTTTITATNTNTNTTDLCEADADTVGMGVSVSEQEKFDLFWEKYPRKQNKYRAREAWNKLSPDNALLERILSALEWQVKQPGWQTEGGRYIPIPSVWLNQHRWEDEETVALPTVQEHSQGTFDTHEFYEAAIRHSMAVYEEDST